MKLKEWIDFNKDIFNGDLLITLIRKGSYSRDDLILESYLSLDDTYTIFGNYELQRALASIRFVIQFLFAYTPPLYPAD